MSFDTISARSVLKYLDTERYRIIDIREPEAFARGHIPGAVNVPYGLLERAMQRMPRTKTYIFYCDRGSASLLAARRFYRNGYDVLSVVGGFHAYEGPKVKGNK